MTEAYKFYGPKRSRLRFLQWASRWMFPVVLICIFPTVIVFWWHQPYFGANYCLRTGFIWSEDFVEEVRPTIRKIVEHDMDWRQRHEGVPAGVSKTNVLAELDRAMGEYKKCASERGIEYCRYIGSDKSGVVMTARTVDGPNAIAPEQENNYRYVKSDLGYEFSIIPMADGSHFRLKVLKGEIVTTGGTICNPGCGCNIRFGL